MHDQELQLLLVVEIPSDAHAATFGNFISAFDLAVRRALVRWPGLGGEAPPFSQQEADRLVAEVVDATADGRGWWRAAGRVHGPHLVAADISPDGRVLLAFTLPDEVLDFAQFRRLILRSAVVLSVMVTGAGAMVETINQGREADTFPGDPVVVFPIPHHAPEPDEPRPVRDLPSRTEISILRDGRKCRVTLSVARASPPSGDAVPSTR